MLWLDGKRWMYIASIDSGRWSLGFFQKKRLESKVIILHVGILGSVLSNGYLFLLYIKVFIIFIITVGPSVLIIYAVLFLVFFFFGWVFHFLSNSRKNEEEIFKIKISHTFLTTLMTFLNCCFRYLLSLLFFLSLKSSPFLR